MLTLAITFVIASLGLLVALGLEGSHSI